MGEGQIVQVQENYPWNRGPLHSLYLLGYRVDAAVVSDMEAGASPCPATLALDLQPSNSHRVGHVLLCHFQITSSVSVITPDILLFLMDGFHPV